jgi:HAD superfamily hydrolase (TIGR01509 family)
VASDVVSLVTASLEKAAPLLPGVLLCLDYFGRKGITLGLCSSSPRSVITAVLDRNNLRAQFAAIHSGEAEEFGKPHPSAYLTTAKQLDVSPSECLVFEDSLNGAISAKAAGMTVFAVTSQGQRGFEFYDCVLESLAEIRDETIRLCGLNLISSFLKSA